MKHWLCFCILLSAFAGFSQKTWTLYVQTSPSGAEIYWGDEKIGETPMLIDKYKLKVRKALSLSLEGYQKYETPNVDVATIAVRLRPKSGYNNTSVTSNFTAVYAEDTIFIDPMRIDDASKSFNCEDTWINYRVLGASNEVLADKFQSCDLSYISYYSNATPIFDGYLSSQELPFPVQQVYLDINALVDQKKSSRKKKEGTGRFDNKQMWFVLAEKDNKQLLFMPLTEYPDLEDKRREIDYSGEIPNRFEFANVVLRRGRSVEQLVQENYQDIIDNFRKNQVLQSALEASESYIDFLSRVFLEPYILGDILETTWFLKHNPQKELDADRVKQMLSDRGESGFEQGFISMGGEQDLETDSAAMGISTSQTPWFLKGGQDSLQLPGVPKSDNLIYDPEEGLRINKNSSEEKWYLKNIDTSKATTIDVNDPKFKNPYKKPRYPKGKEKPWFLRDD